MNKKYLSSLNALLMAATLITFSATAVFSTAIAEEDTEETRKPDDDKVNPLDNVDINIIQREDKTLETHSINGVVYKVKVIPSSGPAYYLYDTDGDGSLETRTNREISETTVQQWKIFQW